MTGPTRETTFRIAAVLLLLAGGLAMFFANENLLLRLVGLAAFLAGAYCAAQARNARRAAAGIVATPRGPSPIKTWHIFACFVLLGATGLSFFSLFLFGNTQFGVIILYVFVGLALVLALFAAWLVAVWTQSWFQR